jgi:putative addiction module component (TIGR02574 family)
MVSQGERGAEAGSGLAIRGKGMILHRGMRKCRIINAPLGAAWAAETTTQLGVVWRMGKRYFKGMADLNSDELARLSPEERLALIGQLWDSLSDTEVPLPEAQQAELARRLSSLDEDRTQAVTWEQLHAELDRRRP